MSHSRPVLQKVRNIQISVSAVFSIKGLRYIEVSTLRLSVLNKKSFTAVSLSVYLCFCVCVCCLCLCLLSVSVCLSLCLLSLSMFVVFVCVCVPVSPRIYVPLIVVRGDKSSPPHQRLTSTTF